MKKIISLVLSFALIFGSISPSYAQGKGKTVKQVGQALTQEGIASRLVKPNVMSRALREARVAGRLAQIEYNVRQVYLAQMAMRTTPKRMEEISSLLNSANFTDANALEVTRQIFMVNHTQANKEMLLLKTFPELLITKGFPVAEERLEDALFFYRRLLMESTSKVSTLAPSQIEEEWGKAMAAVSMLGFYGKPIDCKLILYTYESFASHVNEPALQLAIGRSLLTLGTYREFRNFISLIEKSHSVANEAVWEGFRTAANSLGAEVAIAQNLKKESFVLSKNQEDVLKKYSSLNEKLADPSAQATIDWLALSQQKGAVLKAPAEAVTAREGDAATEAVELPELNLDLNVSLGDNLAVGASPVPQSANTATVTPGNEAPAKPSSNSSNLVSKVSFRVTNLKEKVKNIFVPSDNELADEEARLILANVSPLRSQLRRVLEGAASDNYKQMALLNLYRRGVFNNTLDKLPDETKALIERYSKQPDKSTDLSKLLFNLYQTDVLAKDIANLVDNREQALFSDLEKITQDPSWNAKAQAAYERASVLPLEGENFVGVVPSVPEANQQTILSTFRMEPDFAVKNRNLGIEKGDYIYYPNQIPFYYRNSKGQLSSRPVGILSQEPAGRYGRVLSAIGLASKPGLRVPKGFVLTLDESGQWKWFMPQGSLAIVEGNPNSKKLLAEIRSKGSVRVPVDTPYSTTDLLAMANMLENKPDLNLELVLNTPHSLKQYLTVHGFFVGNDAGASLTGPFKNTLKNVQGFSGLFGNLVSGVGYLTPWVGGALMKKMTKWGNVKTTQAIYALTGAGLLYSLLKLHMYGTVDTTTISLGELAIPTVALVLGASLANSFINTFLNFYKDPTTRTASHLAFSENKQWSRLILTVGTAVAAFAGINWTIVVPVGLALVGLSEMLFLNTPIYMDARRLSRAKKLDADGLLPESEKIYLENAKKAMEGKITPEQEKRYTQTFKDMIATLPEVKDIKTRVKMVYASYAASLMMINQATSTLFEDKGGQILVGTFMLATALTRKFASKMVSTNKVSDDQLTGISLPLLAATGMGLSLLPYNGVAGIVAISFGILHYMATAVPGQLDTARWQNIVSAESQKLKAEVLQRKATVEADETLSPAEKTAQLESLNEELHELDVQEKIWSSEAAKGYSYANGHGLIGITVAALMAFMFNDIAPTWAKDFLATLSNFFGDKETSLSLGRMILGYSAGVATVLSAKNWRLTQDAFQIFRKKSVTAEAILQGKVSAETFSISSKNAERRLAELDGALKKLDNKLVAYGVSSEQKMTDILKTLINTHNRFVAIREVLGADNPSVKIAFENLQKSVKKYQVLLDKNSEQLSVQLAREYDKLAQALFEGGNPKKLSANPSYIEEGTYTLPKGYEKFTEAQALLGEIDNQAAVIRQGKTGSHTYGKIIDYQNRFKQLLAEYAANNAGESGKVALLNKRLNAIMKALKEADRRSNLLKRKAGPTSEEDIQKMRDVLKGY